MPFATSYTISKELTGYENDQTINPSELNLWRVLQINNDGTIDMISEYTSSNAITFKGEVGYKNSVGVLNDIASTYTNSKYTIGSRYPGYKGQTEFLSIDHLSKDSLSSESNGAGEHMTNGIHMNDLNLIQSVLNSKLTYSVDQQGTENAPITYWLAGRNVQSPYIDSVYNLDALFTIFFVRENGVIALRSMYGYGGTTGNRVFAGTNFIRPIVILKSNLSPEDGDGSINTPWNFS